MGITWVFCCFKKKEKRKNCASSLGIQQSNMCCLDRQILIQRLSEDRKILDGISKLVSFPCPFVSSCRTELVVEITMASSCKVAAFSLLSLRKPSSPPKSMLIFPGGDRTWRSRSVWRGKLVVSSLFPPIRCSSTDDPNTSGESGSRFVTNFGCVAPVWCIILASLRV